MSPRSRGGFPPTLKRLGQHFLTDQRALERIVDTLGPTETDTVLEIGPGRGALTDILALRAGKVVAVEIDRALAGLLRVRFALAPTVTVVEADFLKTDPGELGGPGYLLIGNVPYYITTPILFHALAHALPRRAVFLVQKEVAARAMAPPGNRSYGALSVNLQILATVERVFDIPAGAFQPPPKVDSSVIRVTPLAEPVLREGEQQRFRSFVQSLFSQRRKQIGTILRSLQGTTPLTTPATPMRSADALARLGIPTTERPERLAPLQFLELFREIRQGEG
ncbi:MAG: 16S rRNA (adenine(1518)-N(6)/adenine(1519)-N(6))-dimethyltransferase RsmA [Gemmatimonadaceae bacterium]